MKIWTAKESKIRKREFIDTAIQIFSTKGYEKSSINDILKKMKITKGSFYYHFKSKEDLLNAVVDDLTEGIERAVCKTAENKTLSASEKLGKLYQVMIEYRKANKQTYNQLFELQKRSDNAFLMSKFHKKTLSANIKHLQKIIEQGISEGVFNISDPQEAAELYIRLVAICKEKVASLIAKNPLSENSSELYQQADQLVCFYWEVLQRVLGL